MRVVGRSGLNVTDSWREGTGSVTKCVTLQSSVVLNTHVNKEQNIKSQLANNEKQKEAKEKLMPVVLGLRNINTQCILYIYL